MSDTSLKEKTAKGLFWGGFSNGIQQLLNLGFGIVLARLLDASDYGMVGMLTIFSAIAAALQEGGFISALTNRKETLHKDYNAVFWFSLMCSTTIYILLFFAAPLIADFYDTPELIPLSRLSFLGFVISSMSIAPRAYLFKNLRIKDTTVISISSLIVSGIVGITLAANGFAYWGIALQSISFITVMTILNFYFSHWRPRFRFDFTPIKEMIGFSSKIIITNIFTIINNNLFSVLLGKFYSEREVGNFTQANKWNGMGHTTITGMINGIAQPVFTRVADDKARQLAVFRKLLRFTAFISFPAMFGLALIANEFIVIAVTAKWQACVPIMQILCIWGAFVPITYMYSNLLISKGKSNLFMWNTIAQSLVQLTMLLCTISQGILVMAVIYTVINIGWLLIWHYFVNKQIHITLWEVMKDITPYLLISGGVIGTSYFLTIGFHNLYVLLILKIGIAVSLYVFIMWIGKSVIFFESVQFIRKKLLK